MTTLKLRTKVQFPAQVSGQAPLAVSKNNGIWTLSYNPSPLADVIPPSSDYQSDKLVYWNAVTGQIAVLSLQEIVNISTAQASSSPRIVTSSGIVTVGASDTIIVLNKAAPSATTINLPSVSVRNPLGIPVEIYDWAGNAGDITITPSGTENIMGANASWKVLSGGSAQTGGSVRLIPSTALNGWLVR